MRKGLCFLSVSEYISRLLSKDSVPGGGSAAALVSSLGISLFIKVCNFTLGREKYKKYAGFIGKTRQKLFGINRRVMKLVDEDAKAYSGYIFALKSEGEEKEKRIIKALVKSSAVPLEIMRLSLAALEYAENLKQKGNSSLISDIFCGEYFIEAGIRAARENAEINMNGIKQKKIKDSIAGEISRLDKKFKGIKSEIRP